MSLILLDGKTDLLRQVLLWLELSDCKALSSVNRTASRSELRQLVFSQCVLRLPPLQSVVQLDVATEGRSRSNAARNRTSRSNKKRIDTSALDAAPTTSEQDAWVAYYGGTFLRHLDPQIVPFIQRVLVPLSMATRLLGMLQFAPNLQRVGFYNDAIPASAKSKTKQITVMDIGYVCPLATLTALDLSAIKHVHCLDAIETMTTLQTLDLSGTNISNASALSALRNLQVLNLRRTNVASLAFVKPLEQSLRWLDVSDTRIQDFAPLAHLQNLAFLNMSRNWVHDVASLRSLPKLTTLKLCNSGSLGPLELVLYAPHLTALHVHDTMLTDLSFLYALPELTLLDIRRTHTTTQDLASLTALRSLETLLIDDSVVASEPLDRAPERRAAIATWASGLQNVTYLKIDPSSGELGDDDRFMFATRVDGSLLTHLPALQSLETPAVMDYSMLDTAFESLRALELLRWTADDLRGVTSVSAAALTLKSLTLTLPSAATVVDVSSIENLVALERLVLVDALFEDLAPLSALVQLRVLDLSLTSRSKRQLARKFQHARSFAFLSSLTQLETLQLAGRVDLCDVSPLAHLTALQRLNLHGTKVTTLAPLRALHHLVSLNVASTPLQDARDLVQLVTQSPIEELWIPEKLDCVELQQSDSAQLQRLWHRDGFNCLWTNHRTHHQQQQQQQA